MVLGNEEGGNWSYISFLLSPSNPPKVSVGFDELKNQTDLARKQYHAHTNPIGKYNTVNGHNSQLVIFEKNFFTLIYSWQKYKLNASICFFAMLFYEYF